MHSAGEPAVSGSSADGDSKKDDEALVQRLQAALGSWPEETVRTGKEFAMSKAEALIARKLADHRRREAALRERANKGKLFGWAQPPKQGGK